MLVTEDGDVAAAETRDQLYSFAKHYAEDGVYLIVEGDETLKLTRTEGIVLLVATATIG